MSVRAIRHGLILAAGLGTRLHPLTLVRAKPAMPVGGEPLVRRIARWLVSNGVTELVVNLHHLPATITHALGDGSDIGARIRYSWEHPIVLGSAGGPRQALPILGADSFFIVNADVLTEMDLGPLEAAHQASDALVTLTVVPQPQPIRYGGVLVNDDGRVEGFARLSPAASSSRHFIGVQIVEADVFRDLPAGEARNSIGDVYDRLLANGPGPIRSFRSPDRWWDIGTVADYIETSSAFGNESTSTATRAIDPTARLTRTIVWDDVEVGAGAVLEDCIVTDGVRVAAGSRFSKTILIEAEGGLTTYPL
jgi:NDP-sugar pyrophosphorylase family protein